MAEAGADAESLKSARLSARANLEMRRSNALCDFFVEVAGDVKGRVKRRQLLRNLGSNAALVSRLVDAEQSLAPLAKPRTFGATCERMAAPENDEVTFEEFAAFAQVLAQVTSMPSSS